MANLTKMLVLLPSIFFCNLALFGQNGGYDAIVVTNNTDDPICISLQWDITPSPSCGSQGTQNANSYGTLLGGGGMKTVVPLNGGDYVTTVRLFNDACTNSCLTPTIIDLGPGVGTYSGSYVHCTSGDTRTVTVTFSPPGTSTGCGGNATISLDY